MSRAEAPVFIVGCPRSGTTLLAHLLASAGGFAIWRTESHAFNQLGPSFGGLRTRRDREELMDRWLQSEIFFRSGLDAATIRARVVEQCRSAGDFLRTVKDAVREIQGARRWYDDTPDHGLYISAIRAAIPEALFVHCVRDGRDNAVSQIKTDFFRNLHRGDEALLLEKAALQWDYAVTTARAQGRRAGDRYREVFFERLVAEREAVLAGLSEFLGQQLDPRRIERVAIGSVGRPNSSFGGEETKRAVEPVGRWRRAMTPETLRRVERLIGPTLESFGYELGAPGARPGLGDRLRRSAAFARFALRRRLKEIPAFGRRFASSGPLDRRDWGDDAGDPTVRPGEHLEFVRALVRTERAEDLEAWLSGGAPAGRPREAAGRTA